MRCFESARRRAAVGLALLVGAAGAWGHKSSDAYLQLQAAPSGLSVRWDIALRDLDVALDLDGNGDGKLTWGEIRAAQGRIDAYALARLAIEGCALRAVGRGLERRSDGAYAVLHLASDCALGPTPKIGYALLGDLDPTHRGIARIERPGAATAVLLLDPSRDAAGTAVAAAAPGSSAASPSAAPATGVAAAPSRWAFLADGIHHIVTGYDHVLFLLCLLLPSVLRRGPAGWRPVGRLREAVWPVVGIVTAFTLAHSLTLALAALKLVALPAAVIEPAIALTIVLAALDNLVPIFPVRRWIVALVFGLIHGFGFAGVLAELDLPTATFAWALLQFNLGLELGQLAIVAVVTTALFALRGWTGYPRWVMGAGSLAAIAVGVHWLIERTTGVSMLPL